MHAIFSSAVSLALSIFNTFSKRLLAGIKFFSIISITARLFNASICLLSISRIFFNISRASEYCFCSIIFSAPKTDLCKMSCFSRYLRLCSVVLSAASIARAFLKYSAACSQLFSMISITARLFRAFMSFGYRFIIFKRTNFAPE